MANDEKEKFMGNGTDHHFGDTNNSMGAIGSDSRGNASLGVNGDFSVISAADTWLLEHIIGCYVSWHAEMSVTGRISDAEKMVMAPIMDAANLMLIKLKTYGSTNQ